MNEREAFETPATDELRRELDVMRDMVVLLDRLSHMARRRVLRWAWLRYIAQEPLDEQ
jgi:hypothetical protein